MSEKLKRANELALAFEYGVDYGLFRAEQERYGEILSDALECYFYSGKTCIPSKPSKRRAGRSDKWLENMRSGVIKFINLVAEGEQ